MKPGETMMEFRSKAGLTRRDMAAQLGITPGSLWRIEMGKVFPRHSTIERFCSTMNLSLAFFYNKSMTIEDYQTK